MNITIVMIIWTCIGTEYLPGWIETGVAIPILIADMALPNLPS